MNQKLKTTIESKLNDQKKLDKIIENLSTKKNKDIKLLIRALENCNFHYYALEIVTNSNVMYFRNTREIIKMLYTLKEFEYDKKIYELLTDYIVLKNRSVEEQIILAKTLSDCKNKEYPFKLSKNLNVLSGKYKRNQNIFLALFKNMFLYVDAKKNLSKVNSYKIKENYHVLKKLTIEEIIKLMNTLDECNNKLAYKLATLKFVLNERNIDEIIQLIYALKDCDYREEAYFVAIDHNFIRYYTINEQINIMYVLKECNYAINIKTISSFSSGTSVEELIYIMRKSYNNRKKPVKKESSKNINKIRKENEYSKKFENYIEQVKNYPYSQIDLCPDTTVPVYRLNKKNYHKR